MLLAGELYSPVLANPQLDRFGSRACRISVLAWASHGRSYAVHPAKTAPAKPHVISPGFGVRAQNYRALLPAILNDAKKSEELAHAG
jgi:hypothetical protein